MNQDSAFSQYPTRSDMARDVHGDAPSGSYHKHMHIKVMAVFYTFWALLSLSLVSLAVYKIVTDQADGEMLRLDRNRLVGSYWALSARSRG